MNDDRNYDITNKLYEILNNVKNFEVAMSNPRGGKIIVEFNGVRFNLQITPIADSVRV